MQLAIKGGRLVIQQMCLCLIAKELYLECQHLKKDNMARATPHDLFEIEMLFKEICSLVKKAGINLKGLFLNADPGFDSEGFRKVCESEYITPNVNRTAEAAKSKK